MNSTTAKPQLKVFISYSHRDEELKKALEDHLSGLKNSEKVEIWQDRKIGAGTEWNQQILEEIDAADVILLLVTARFLNSNFCFGKEMKRAMMRHEQTTARVIPIILAPCTWQSAPFAKLNVLPTDGKAVTEWPNVDSAYTNVAQGISNAVDSILKARYGPLLEEDDGWSTPPKASSTSDDGWSTPPPTTPAIAPTSTPAPRATAKPKSAMQRRLELFQYLSALPEKEFNSILYAIGLPPSNMPSRSAAQGERVPALLDWAQSPVGCGLEKLKEAINLSCKSLATPSHPTDTGSEELDF